MSVIGMGEWVLLLYFDWYLWNSGYCIEGC